LSPGAPSRSPRSPQAAKGPGHARPSKTAQANNILNASEGGGRHSRANHVAKSDTFLKNRNITTATSFQTAHDQNKTVAKAIGTAQANQNLNLAKNSTKHKEMTISGNVGRTPPPSPASPRAGQTFNAKVTEPRWSCRRAPARSSPPYPSKFVALPKPAPGPSLKPTTKANVQNIATRRQRPAQSRSPGPQAVGPG